MKKIAIVGARDYPDAKPLVKYFIEKLDPERHVIVTGGATGVDTVAKEIGDELGFAVMVLRANWKKYGKAAGPIRNKLIISEADELIAFSFKNSRGTTNTIELARIKGIPITEVFGK